MEFVVLGLVAVNLLATAVLFTKKSSGSVDTKGLEQNLRDEINRAISNGYSAIDGRLDRFTKTVDENLRASREELGTRLDAFANTIQEFSAASRREAAEGRKQTEDLLTVKLKDVADQLEKMRAANDLKLTEISKSVEGEMNKMRESNEQKLEKMRETVDEKLHGTLEKRLGESFKQVSDKLEAVHRGLGEMQSLATGVGDLKRVLTNVKSRGSWGEVQLGRQVEDMLTADQYETNVAVKPGSADRVEYAIKLPGRSEGEHVYLPIDAKFPQEDHERLLTAQESGTSDEITSAAKTLENVVRAEAKKISDKYISPPQTTDFAIMYLPTEGLYAEVIRREGLAYELQQKHHVLIAGPTNFAAMLNSLQMGFRTLAIEKSTSEVWKILGAAKAEFEKYALVWEKVNKQLGTVQNTVSEVATRSRAIGRSLKKVESLDSGSSATILELEDFVVPEDDSEAEVES